TAGRNGPQSRSRGYRCRQAVSLLERWRMHPGRPARARVAGSQRLSKQWKGSRVLMLKAISTYVYIKERLHPGLLDGLVRGGAQAIEIFAARQHLDYANRKQHVREIADWFRTSGVPLHSVHSPMYSDYEFGRTGAPPVNVCSTDRAQRVAAMDEIKRALEIAEQIPF